ncbi:MAG: TIGR04211 family SH3 domain-containing protein [Gammaproteobacteria bacterium]|jgi:SH3 domain protein|nr:TIGR04211 family SH3 domain-containing protein [Gammaproteobacteria bacterium]
MRTLSDWYEPAPAAARRGLWLACAAVLIGLAGPGPARAETAYVTDMLQLDLYDNASLGGEPLRRLRSGDQLEVLERRDRKARVKLESGEVGWVKSLFIVDIEPARTRANKLEAQVAELESQVDELRTRLAAEQQRLNDIESNKSTAVGRLRAAEQELDELRASNALLSDRMATYASSIPLSWTLAGMVFALLFGAVACWYWIDSRSRARHGGYRVY